MTEMNADNARLLEILTGTVQQAGDPDVWLAQTLIALDVADPTGWADALTMMVRDAYSD